MCTWTDLPQKHPAGTFFFQEYSLLASKRNQTIEKSALISSYFLVFHLKILLAIEEKWKGFFIFHSQLAFAVILENAGKSRGGTSVGHLHSSRCLSAGTHPKFSSGALNWSCFSLQITLGVLQRSQMKIKFEFEEGEAANTPWAGIENYWLSQLQPFPFCHLQTASEREDFILTEWFPPCSCEEHGKIDLCPV